LAATHIAIEAMTSYRTWFRPSAGLVVEVADLGVLSYSFPQ
jgi:hypothetical protein